LELPVLDQNQGAIAQAEAQRKLAAAKFLALQAQVCAQIDRAVAALQAARDQWQNTDRLLAAERRQAESVAAQFAAGAADRLDVLNAQLEIASAALAGLDHQEKLQTALGTLEDALQQPADSLATVIAKMTAKM
jgi:outer membrane protein TolC